MIRLAIRVPRSHADAALAELLELVPGGLEERDLDDDVVEYALYGAPGELPSLPELHASVGDGLVEVSTSELPDDWRERWRDFHHAVLIEPPARAGNGESAETVRGLHVRAPWLEPSERSDALEIVIDPGQAFGTGAHATTRLCLELLLAAASEGVGGPVLDVGTGSGVLGIAASALGYAPVIAIDSDPLSIDAARANAALNGAPVEVRRADLRAGVPGWPTAPLLLANLLRPLLVALARALPASPQHLIAGGLLHSELDAISALYTERFTLQERARRRRGEWGALWLSLDQRTP